MEHSLFSRNIKMPAKYIHKIIKSIDVNVQKVNLLDEQCEQTVNYLWEVNKMKAAFENGVSTYSGKYDEVVYQSWFRGRLCYVRKYAYPTLGEVHENMKNISLNLNSLYMTANPLYVADLKAYAKKNQSQNVSRIKENLHKMPSSKSLFIHCMWMWYDSDPTHVDLKTVTLADIMLMDAPVQTISKCVDAGYLRRVKGYDTYTNEIVL